MDRNNRTDKNVNIHTTRPKNRSQRVLLAFKLKIAPYRCDVEPKMIVEL